MGLDVLLHERLPSGLTNQEKKEAVDDAKDFLALAESMGRPNLNMFLGRAKFHSIITSEIIGDKRSFSIKAFNGGE